MKHFLWSWLLIGGIIPFAVLYPSYRPEVSQLSRSIETLTERFDGGSKVGVTQDEAVFDQLKIRIT